LVLTIHKEISKGAITTPQDPSPSISIPINPIMRVPPGSKLEIPLYKRSTKGKFDTPPKRKRPSLNDASHERKKIRRRRVYTPFKCSPPPRPRSSPKRKRP